MHTKSIPSILKELDSHPQSGLTTKESEQRLVSYGRNVLKEEKSKSFLGLLLDQFKSILIVILIVAALLSSYIGEFTEGIVIMVIVVLNAFVGAAQEKSAGNAVKALKSMVSPLARVIRDQTLMEIASELLVPGDIIELESGNLVPADIRLIEAVNFKVDESALTGESVPVEKNAEIELEANTPLSERVNSAYLGTTVAYGRAKGIVVRTGMHTEIGQIASMLEGQDEVTPLQKKLDQLGSKLGLFCLAVCVIIFMLGYLRGMPLLEIFMIAISLAVAAVPEGLPAIVTVILALGMKRMVSRHVLVKNLSSVETLGSTTVICSDKTGTLTQNKMTVTKIFDGQAEHSVSGFGYSPHGIIEGDFEKDDLEKMMLVAVLCNDASLTEDSDILGDPTEAALLVMAEKAGFSYKELSKKYLRLQEYPFDSERKMMSTLHEIDGQSMIFSKGSPDSILKVCDRIKIKDTIVPIEPHLEFIHQIYMNWASSALRVLCYAGKQVSSDSEITNEESNLIFFGMSAMIDPERPEAKKSIKTCKDAGIRVIMITGDHGVTATAIGKNIGLLSGKEEAISGAQINQMSDAAFITALKNHHVFSRVSPQHKVRIVEALKNSGNIVAMTGDGVNDAPSLKKADIGIAMGITGTDVSKEASDMILTDDNFASIVGAVEEGRVIYSNIRKFVSFLVSCNIGEILLIFISMLIGWGSPLRPIQLLWVNLITDSLPAFALGMEPEEDDVMKATPRNPSAPIIDKRMSISILFQAVGLSVATLISYRMGYAIHPDYANTFAFITLISGELLRSFSGRSETRSVLKTGFLGNKYLNFAVFGSYLLTLAIIILPFMREIFRIHALNIQQLMTALALSLIPFLAGELAKKFKA